MCVIRLASDLIRDLRTERGLSLRDLADVVDIDRRTLAKLEGGGDRDPRIGTVHKLAHHYGLPYTALIIEVPEPDEGGAVSAPAPVPHAAGG